MKYEIEFIHKERFKWIIKCNLGNLKDLIGPKITLVKEKIYWYKNIILNKIEIYSTVNKFLQEERFI